MDNCILNSETLKNRILAELSFLNKIQLVSAYITEHAVDWLIEEAVSLSEVIVVGRLTPHDIANNSSSIAALNKILDQGWQLRTLPSLHAKIYLLDSKKMFVGSANFTSNGLKLYGEGNLEASVEVEATEENLKFVENIVSSSVRLDYDAVKQMENFVKDNDKNINISSEWPHSILPSEMSVWVTDFPWENLAEKAHPDSSVKHDKYLFGETNEYFLGSKCLLWLRQSLQEKETKELYFGELSAKLHSDLKDDPAPYRKDVKGLLVNLLSYIVVLNIKDFKIDKPNYSQRIKLLR